MYALARKDHLARNLSRMQKAYPDDYHFFPQTWLLPSDFGEFRKQFKEQNNSKKKLVGRKTFISKPEASCQGKGIYLTRTLDDFDKNEHCIVQRYLHKPFLIDNLKFDLRIYVLLCGVDPLRVYFYKEGLCRLATCEYRPP
jgi:tubulin polyglutamylase TTLL6/13